LAVESVHYLGPTGPLTSSQTAEWMAVAFDVETDSEADDEFIVKASALGTTTPDQLLKKNDVLPDQLYWVVDQVRIERIGPTMYRYVCDCRRNYISVAGAPVPDYDNPFDMPPDVTRFVPYVEYEPVDRDVDGNPIQNSVQQNFDPPPQRAVYGWDLVIAKNVPIFDPDFAERMMGAINASDWRVVTPKLTRLFISRTAKCEMITPTLVAYHGGWYAHVEHAFKCRLGRFKIGEVEMRDDWTRRFLDQGTRKLVTDESGSHYEPITTTTQVLEDGELVDRTVIVGEPVRLHEGLPLESPDGAGDWLRYRIEPEEDFDLFGFGPPSP
jgi:hypothetical protein